MSPSAALSLPHLDNAAAALRMNATGISVRLWPLCQQRFQFVIGGPKQNKATKSFGWANHQINMRGINRRKCPNCIMDLSVGMPYEYETESRVRPWRFICHPGLGRRRGAGISKGREDRRLVRKDKHVVNKFFLGHTGKFNNRLC